MVDDVCPNQSIHVSLTRSPIDVASRRAERPGNGDFGGYVSFEGVIRRQNNGLSVQSIHYECYDVLAKKEIHRIIQSAVDRNHVGFCEVIHRVGDLQVGDVAVFVHVMARHRREAFDVCTEVMDELKKTVPIWKKEYYSDGSYSWPKCHHNHL